MKQDIANVVTKARLRLNGFKVLGAFPFHLSYITTNTHIKLCAIREQIRLASPEQPKADDFYNAKLMAALKPLVEDYCVTALLNSRVLSFLMKPFLKYKISRCGHQHLWNVYMTVYKLNEPAFFLSYWNQMIQVDNTLLKEVTTSLEKSSNIKKKQE